MRLNFQGGARFYRAQTFFDQGSTESRPTNFFLPFLAAMILFFAVGAMAETTNTLSDAEIQGRKLAQQLCEGQPAQNFTNTGVLKIRDGMGNRTNYVVQCEVIVQTTNWISKYTSDAIKPWMEELSIVHTSDSPNVYHHWRYSDSSSASMLANDRISSFAKSDFWLADLGLEFFHWPQQKILPKMTNLKRGREYTLLESTNPNPSTNGYSRVLSWIDKESGGILEAEAYDIHGKLLKDFAPKSFKKVNGQWELQEMEIRNVQTGSRTQLEFDLKNP